MRCRREQSGFTLLEVLVALSIFAVLGIGAYRVLSGAITAHERLRERQQAVAQLTFAVRSLHDELSQVVERGVRAEYGDREEAFIGTAQTLVFSYGGWSNPLGHRRGSVQRVSYGLGSENTGLGANPAASLQKLSTELMLQRHFWIVLDRAQDTLPLTRNLVSLRELNFRYLGDEGEWHGAWPPLALGAASGAGAAQALPLAVEVTLSSQRFGEIRRLVKLRDRQTRVSDADG